MTTPEKTVKKINERQETEIIDAEAVKRLSQDTAEEETKAIDLEVHAGHGQKREAERKRHMVMQTTEVRHRSGQVRQESIRRREDRHRRNMT